MAAPMTPTQLISQLKKWHISFAEYKDWKTHNRNHKGPWSNINGLMVHHTGSDSTDQRALLYNGHSSLPGPLSQFGLAQNGTLHLIGWGRANHAGGGDPNVLNHVINEDYSGTLKPRYHDGERGAVDGNARFYGVEIWYSGNHQMTSAQLYTLMLLSAAICDFHKWSSKSVIAHGEWSDWKWDPGIKASTMLDMPDLRTSIAAVLKKGPTTVISRDPMSTNFKQVWTTDSAKPPKGHETESNPYWAPISILRGAYEQAEQARKNTEAIMKHLGI